MGIEERIPLSRAGLDMIQPVQKALIDYTTQSPVGCRYLDQTANYTSCGATAATVLDLRAGGIQYDPYDLIDLTNNRITIPHPGVWDVAVEVIAADVTAINDYIYVQFSQDNTGVAAEGELADFQSAFAAGQSIRLLINSTSYVTQEQLNTFGKLFWITCYNASASSNDVKIISLSLWLRSARPPSKY